MILNSHRSHWTTRLMQARLTSFAMDFALRASSAIARNTSTWLQLTHPFARCLPLLSVQASPPIGGFDGICMTPLHKSTECNRAALRASQRPLEPPTRPNKQTADFKRTGGN